MLKKLIREYEKNHSQKTLSKIEELASQGYGDDLDDLYIEKLKRIL